VTNRGLGLMLRSIIGRSPGLKADSFQARWIDLEDNLVAVQGQRDAVSRSSQVGERKEQVRLRLENDAALFEELLEGVAAQHPLRHRSRHQIPACGLIADRDREAVGILQAVLSGGGSAAGSEDPHQLKPRIGLHDEGRGTGRTHSSTKAGRDDVDEREGIGVVHK